MNKNQMTSSIEQIKDVLNKARENIIEVIKSLVNGKGEVQDEDEDGKPSSVMLEFGKEHPSCMVDVNGDAGNATIHSIYISNEGVYFYCDAETKSGEFEDLELEEKDFDTETLVLIAECIKNQ